MVNKNKEKESDREIIDKKRRKSSSNNVAESSIKSPKDDIYTSVVKFEDQESRLRTPEKDADLFHETCNNLRKLFSQINDFKKQQSDKAAKSEINEKRIEGSFQFVVLKKLNRLDKVRLRTGRDTLQKAKLSVDSNKLQLQNLLYEAEHLRKEVQRCFQFKSQDEEIDLVEEEQFYEQAPESIARPEETKNDEHVRRLARLEWELQQRKELASLCTELQSAKEKVAQDIESKSDRLDSLAPRLEALLKATRPLQEVLDMNIESEWKVQKIARLLPKPLYLVYVNLSAYAEACDKFLITTINGDEDEAKQLEDDDNKDHAEESDDIQSDNDENNDNSEENERSSKSHHHRRQSKTAMLESKKSNLLKPHPLSVTFKICTKNSKSSLSIILSYLPMLNLITAQCVLNDFPTGGVAAGDTVAPNSILNCLTAGDVGEESSNPKTKYQLEDVSIDPKNLLTLLNEKNLGKPYKWSQQMCGLDFATSTGISSYQLAQSSIPDTVKQIRYRWICRMELFKQIHALESKNTDFLKSFDPEPIVSLRISSSLVQWTSITWPDYLLVPAANRFVEENFATEHDLFYRAVIIRGSAKLECSVCISTNFPINVPIWALALSWNGMHNAQNSATIREMESYINSASERNRKTCTALATQLKRTLSCLDIYLETEGMITNSTEFSPDKTFLKAFRGRTRARPFKIIANNGNVIYTQI